MKNYISFLVFAVGLLGGCAALDGPPKHSAFPGMERDYSLETSSQRSSVYRADDDVDDTALNGMEVRPVQIAF